MINLKLEKGDTEPLAIIVNALDSSKSYGSCAERAAIEKEG